MVMVSKLGSCDSIYETHITGILARFAMLLAVTKCQSRSISILIEQFSYRGWKLAIENQQWLEAVGDFSIYDKLNL